MQKKRTHEEENKKKERENWTEKKKVNEKKKNFPGRIWTSNHLPTSPFTPTSLNQHLYTTHNLVSVFFTD